MPVYETHLSLPTPPGGFTASPGHKGERPAPTGLGRGGTGTVTLTAPPANGRPRGLLGSGVPQGAAGRAPSGPAGRAPSGPAAPPPAGRRWRAARDAAFRAAGCWLDRGRKAGRGCAVPLGVQGQVSGLAPRVWGSWLARAGALLTVREKVNQRQPKRREVSSACD